jgi:chemotaxis protein CheX
LIDQELLNQSVIEATTDVFSTMLDLAVKHSGPAADAPLTGAGLMAIVGLTGEWAGSGVFRCSPAFASVICSRMLGSETDPDKPSIDEEVLDVVAEVTNMVIGNIKNALERATGPLAISVPTVIHGRNFQMRNPAAVRGSASVFEAGDERFEIRVSLAPAAEKGARSRVPVFGLAHL